MLRGAESACPRSVRRIVDLAEVLLQLVDEDGEDLPLQLRVTGESMVEIEGHRQDELPHGNMRDDLVDEMRRRLCRAPRGANRSSAVGQLAHDSDADAGRQDRNTAESEPCR